MPETKPRLSARSVKACSDRDSLESKFKKHKMTKSQIIDFLIEAMGNPAVSYSSGYPSLEERYEVIVGAYLSGIWKRDYSSLKAMGNSNGF